MLAVAIDSAIANQLLLSVLSLLLLASTLSVEQAIARSIATIERAKLAIASTLLVGLFTISPLELASGYAVASLTALGGGGSLSLQVRSLLAMSGQHVESYYAAVTWHALLMIFGFIMPLLFGVISNGTLSSSVGVSDLLLPRLNSVGLWLLLDAVALMTITQSAAAPTGWTLYPPLSTNEAVGVDWAIIALHTAGVSSIALSINLLATTYCSYLSRLSWRSIALTWWAVSVANVLLVLTLPALAAAITMLLLDRHCNASYYAIDGAGEPVLYQHLFWFFGSAIEQASSIVK